MEPVNPYDIEILAHRHRLRPRKSERTVFFYGINFNKHKVTGAKER